MRRLLPRHALRAALPCAFGVAAGVRAAAEPYDEWAAQHAADPSDLHADGEPAFVHADLRAIYSSLPDVHAIPESEEAPIDATGGHEGYGELTRGAVVQMQKEHGRVPLVFSGAYDGSAEYMYVLHKIQRKMKKT